MHPRLYKCRFNLRTVPNVHFLPVFCTRRISYGNEMVTVDPSLGSDVRIVFVRPSFFTVIS